MEKNHVIIGGGTAGLCAAIRLTELGSDPLIIEAGEYPSHKVCGEFFSPECIELLNRWNIHPIAVPYVRFHRDDTVVNIQFPTPAGSLSHIAFDPMLLKRAVTGGASILTNCKVEKVSQESYGHKLELSSGEVIYAKNLIIATGKIPNFNLSPPVKQYIGIKAHFENIQIDDSLQMFAFNRAYIGISPIEKCKYNVACLAEIDHANKWESPELFINALKQKNRELDRLFNSSTMLFPEWMTATIPAFGIRTTPPWPSTYFIGDASCSIPPITGGGLSMAIIGGCMAADYAMNEDAVGFKKAWKARIKSSIFFGKIFHRLITSPFFGKTSMKLAEQFPLLGQICFQLTRCKRRAEVFPSQKK